MDITKKRDNIFYLHFDVDSHRMPIEEYLKAIEGAKEVFEGLNQEIFGGKLKYDLDVYAPENGTLTIKISYKSIRNASITLAAIVTFLDSPTPSAYIKGLMDQTPAEYANELGKSHRQSMEEVLDMDDVADIHKKVTKGFLEKSPEELLKNKIHTSQFRKAYTGKNKFYSACSQVDDLKGVGFTNEENDFPVQSPYFEKHIAILPENEKQSEWIVKQKERIVVFSPCWDDQEDVNWQAKWNKKNLSFKVRDDMFWKTVIEERLQNVTTKDVLEVQIAIARKRGPRTGVVLSVLKYNGQEISPLKTGEEIDAILQSYQVEDLVEDKQIPLFNEGV